MQEGGGNIQGSGEKKSGNTRKNQTSNDHQQPRDNKEDEHDRKSIGGGQESNASASGLSSGYFGDGKRNKMTVIFHAVLAPHFKFEESQGDKIFMRFGGAAFGEFLDDVVEVHPER